MRVPYSQRLEAINKNSPLDRKERKHFSCTIDYGRAMGPADVEKFHAKSVSLDYTYPSCEADESHIYSSIDEVRNYYLSFNKL